MLRIVIGLVILAATVYALVDCLQTPGSRAQWLPKIAWVALIVLIPVLGPAAWIFLGRSATSAPHSGPRRPRRHDHPRGPDDDPDFLRSL